MQVRGRKKVRHHTLQLTVPRAFVMSSSTSTTALLAGSLLLGVGFASGYLVKGFLAVPEVQESDSDDESYSDESSDGASDSGEEVHEECKMVLVVRTDLKMGKGKTAAQCGHATLGAYKRAVKHTPNFVRAWETYGQAKITLKVDNEEVLHEIAQKAQEMGIAAYIVEDAGRTQIAAGSRTVLGLGPAPVSIIDQLTGRKGQFPLKLLS